MAMSSFLNVNGYNWPAPARGFTYVISTTVNSGRNANNTVIGQRIGRDLYKLDSMTFRCLPAETRRMMLQSLKDFYVPVTFEDYVSGGIITLTMYPGDRKGTPYWVDTLTHMITMDETFSVNLIDVGEVD